MIYNFENYSLDANRQELRCGANLVSIEPQVFDLLQYLICHRDRVVTKDDLIAHVWNGRLVSESTLSSRITAVRHAIGDSGVDQRFIRTVARKGIRFVGDIREIMDPSAADNSLKKFGSTPFRLPEKPSIAVLPFINMSGDAEQEYFSDGITEDIITALSRLRWFFVIARNSTFAYKGQATDVRQVGRDLGVRYTLEGSVRKCGRRVRITAQLMDAMAGNYIWADLYDRELVDIFGLQDEITTSVIAAIEPKLVAAEGIRAASRSIDDLDAWDLVARALSHFWKLTPVENEAAINILRQALEQHPNYAPAHSILAFSLLTSAYVGFTPPGSDREYAAHLAQRALELDDGDPWAYMAFGYLAFTCRKTTEAIHHYQAALDLNPNFAAAHGHAGYALALNGQSDEALKRFEQALRMSPRDPFNSFFFLGISVAHYLAKRYQDAIQWARHAVQLRPGTPSSYRILCASLAQARQTEEANAAMRTLRQLQPEVSIAWIKQSVPYTAGPMTHFLDGMRKAGLTDP
jgi:TolB-like protein/Tfp pilus assembly protein PilF